MARPMCMSEDGKQAVFVGTMMETGEAFTLCDECLVAWSAALLQAMTGVDAMPFLEAISDGEPPPGAPGDDGSELTAAELNAEQAKALQEAAQAASTPPLDDLTGLDAEVDTGPHKRSKVAKVDE